MLGQALFDYYKDIMPDQDGWRRVVQAPLPLAFWCNRLKTSPEVLVDSLEQDGMQLTPLAWCDHAFRTDAVSGLGRHWTYLTGQLQIQEEVSMLAGHVLDAQPGENIIDLCAAPGNKTAQIAVAMNNTGSLIANDRDFGRMRAFGQIQKRLGLLNVSSTIYDATSYPKLNNQFDRVMADVPCSCEGTFRKGKRRDSIPDSYRSMQMTNTQIPILRKAIKMCKPGGRIVYSTCTFAPEENEGVLDSVLNSMQGAVRLLPIEISGFISSPGLAEWQGRVFDGSISHAIRVWPQQNNTGGFFVALLEKVA